MCELLITLAMTDGLVDPNEMRFLKDHFDEDVSFYEKAMDVPYLEACETVSGMSMLKKLDFGKLLLELAMADGKKHQNEDKLIAVLFSRMGILELLTIK